MDNIKTTNIEDQATSKRVATLLGLTQRRIQQLTAEGILIKESTGKYNLPLAIQAYIEFIKMKNVPKSEQQTDYWNERAVHEAAKRKLTEIKLAKLENRMHDAHDVELVMTDMLTNLRTQLLGLPSALCGQLVGLSMGQICEIMTKRIEEKLLELSDYAPDLFSDEELGD